jgi:hypothetical protein
MMINRRVLDKCSDDVIIVDEEDNGSIEFDVVVDDEQSRINI